MRPSEALLHLSECKSLLVNEVNCKRVEQSHEQQSNSKVQNSNDCEEDEVKSVLRVQVNFLVAKEVPTDVVDFTDDEENDLEGHDECSNLL